MNKLITIVLVALITGCTEKENKHLVQSEKKTETTVPIRKVNQGKALTAKEAVENLRLTKSFADDFRSNQTSFSIKIDNLTPDTNEYYYMKTRYVDRNKNEQIISSYRVYSKSGTVAKKNMKTNKWNEVN
jgi:hypothetical protein